MIADQPSQHFREAFGTNCSGCYRQCDRCKVVFFDASDNQWDWEPGEFEELSAKEKANPDEYVSIDGSIGGYLLWGMEITNCCGCGKHMESVLLHHREQLCKYLGAVLHEERDQTTKDIAALGACGG